jgi:hypothetical protein
MRVLKNKVDGKNYFVSEELEKSFLEFPEEIIKTCDKSKVFKADMLTNFLVKNKLKKHRFVDVEIKSYLSYKNIEDFIEFISKLFFYVSSYEDAYLRTEIYHINAFYYVLKKIKEEEKNKEFKISVFDNLNPYQEYIDVRDINSPAKVFARYNFANEEELTENFDIDVYVKKVHRSFIEKHKFLKNQETKDNIILCLFILLLSILFYAFFYC